MSCLWLLRSFSLSLCHFRRNVSFSFVCLQMCPHQRVSSYPSYLFWPFLSLPSCCKNLCPIVPELGKRWFQFFTASAVTIWSLTNLLIKKQHSPTYKTKDVRCKRPPRWVFWLLLLSSILSQSLHQVHFFFKLTKLLVKFSVWEIYKYMYMLLLMPNYTRNQVIIQ